MAGASATHAPGAPCREGTVLCIAPLTFYVHVFRPCFDCYDFESTAVHEIGHLLGLSHPDEYEHARKVATLPTGPESDLASSPPDLHLISAPDLAQVATLPMGPESCRYPLAYLRNESEVAAADRRTRIPNPESRILTLKSQP